MPAKYLAQAFLPRSLTAIALALLTAAACGGSQTDVQSTTGAATPPDPGGGEETTETTDDAALIDVLADRETEILIDGKKAGTTPISAYKVAPGNHEVTFVDERNGNRTMTVSVGPGEAKTVKSDLPPPIQEQKDEEKK